MSELKDNIENELNTLLNRFITGSNIVKVVDLIESEDLTLSFKWSDNWMRDQREGDISKEFVPVLPNAKRPIPQKRKKLVLADPGIGKSTISYLVFYKAFSQFRDEHTNLCPIFIDLNEYKGNGEFGSEAWLKDYLNKISGNVNLKWVHFIGEYESFAATPYIILDSLDEYLSDCTLKEIQAELNKYIFKEAHVICCRTQFYEYYIASSNRTFVKNFETLVLQQWSYHYERIYAKWYFKNYFNHSDEVILSFLQEKLSSPDLLELCKVPLRFNMILEILAKNEMNFNLVKRRISVYHNFTIMTIRHESSRIGSALDVDDKLLFLRILAWHFYDERSIGEGMGKIRFSSDNLRQVLLPHLDSGREQNIDVVVNELIRSSVLLEDTNDEFEPNFSCIKFSHKSIQEFFVAKYIYEEIMSKKPANFISQIYRSFISQEIDIFLKDFFENINKDIQLGEIAAQNLIEAFLENLPHPDDERNIVLRKRIARNQLGYNLGHLSSKSAIDFLENILEKETDEFIKRSIIIGMSIGHHKNSLDEYVDSLRVDPISTSNVINIGFQLSYFGDQPFDVLQPYIDQGLPKSYNTVKKLVQALRLSTNEGAWRIDLYSLLYLKDHRKHSENDFWIAIRENKEQFGIAVYNLAADPVYSQWPETKEAIQLLMTLNQQI